MNHKERCRNCGLTRGAHLGTAYNSEFYKRSFPANYCPGHEGRMDWDQGPGTVFQATGDFTPVGHGTPAAKEPICTLINSLTWNQLVYLLNLEENFKYGVAECSEAEIADLMCKDLIRQGSWGHELTGLCKTFQ